MTTKRSHVEVAPLVAAVALLAVGPSVVSGQEPAAAPAPETPAAAAPAPKEERHVTMERIQNGFLVAPDNKFTDIGGRYANLLGFYAGYMMDRTLFIGGGGYWQTNAPYGQEMSYGGGIFEWLVHGDRRLAWGARALIGGGSAEVTSPIGIPPVPVPYPYPMPGGGGPGGSGGPWGPTYPWPPYGAVHHHEGFFVAEPQLNLSWKIAGWVHLSAGGGYRFVAGTHNMDSRLSGASGTLSLQLGGGS